MAGQGKNIEYAVTQQYIDKINDLKSKISRMIKSQGSAASQNGESSASEMWTEVLGIYGYIFNLSAEDFLNIRYHTGLISGSDVFNYWQNSPGPDPDKYARRYGYEYYTRNLPDIYKISEPTPLKNPIKLGVDYHGYIINAPTIRYQSCISNLYNMGVFDTLKNNARSVVLEVGGGYGGLSHHLRRFLGNCTYIIIDLPAMLLYSGGYLLSHNQDKKIYVYDKDTFTPDFIRNDMLSHDFVLLPNFALKDLGAIKEINLMVNMLSFPEMTKRQIDDYLQLGYSKLNGYIYSDNMDSHPFNRIFNDGETVTAMLSNYFKLFPSPVFYDKYCKLYDNPFFTRPYLGIRKDTDAQFKMNGAVKVIDDATRYSVYFNGKNTVKYQKERDWTKYLYQNSLAFAKKLLK